MSKCWWKSWALLATLGAVLISSFSTFALTSTPILRTPPSGLVLGPRFGPRSSISPNQVVADLSTRCWRRNLPIENVRLKAGQRFDSDADNRENPLSMTQQLSRRWYLFWRQGSTRNDPTSSRGGRNNNPLLAAFTPLLMFAAASSGLLLPSIVSPLGSPVIARRILAVLMLSMGVSVTLDEMKAACRSPRLLALNAAMCFFLMPMVGVALARSAPWLDPAAGGTGIILLSSVSGGQASNLFALLAGGDAALSVACTVTTTVLGAVAIPAVVKNLLRGTSVEVDAIGVLLSVASLTLVPLLAGLSFSKVTPSFANRVRPAGPKVALGATFLLVAGGAAQTSALFLSDTAAFLRAGLAATLLPLLGGAVALFLCRPVLNLSERTTRTLVVETLSKSPILAYVLAGRHFGGMEYGASAVPAAAMVTLGIVGSVVSSAWSLIPVKEDGL